MQPSPARPLPADRAALRRDAAVVSPYATDDCRDPLAVRRRRGRRGGRRGRRSTPPTATATTASSRGCSCTPPSSAARPRCSSGQWALTAWRRRRAAVTARAVPSRASTPQRRGSWTLLHALLECPAVRPALRGSAASGCGSTAATRLPHTGSLDPGQLCDLAATGLPARRPLAYPPHRRPVCVWGLRDRRVTWTTQFSPAEVAESFRDLRRVIRSEWARASSDVTRIPGARSTWFPPASGRQAARFDVAKFEAKWCANDVLASVGRAPGGQPTVRLRLRRRRLATSHGPASPHTPYTTLDSFSFHTCSLPILPLSVSPSYVWSC